MNNEYQIGTIKDIILNIPPEKTSRCLDELKTGILQMQSLIIAAKLQTDDQDIIDTVINSVPDTLKWIDDNKNKSTINVTTDNSTDAISFTIETTPVCEDDQPQIYLAVKEDDEANIIIPSSELVVFIEANNFAFDQLVITKKIMSQAEYDALPEYLG